MPRMKVMPVSEVRANLAGLVEEVSQTQQPCFVASRSKVRAVLLGIEQYDALIECCAFVNFRRTDVGDPPVLALLLNGRNAP